MMKTKVLLIMGLFALIAMNSCVEVAHQYQGLAPGIWRAVLKLDDVVTIQNSDLEIWELSDDAHTGELPFNFEVIYEDADSFYIKIINADEEIVITEIEYGRDNQTANDTVIIRFPLYDTYIRGIFKENMMEGRWYVPNRGNYSIPFVAFHGQSHRFTTNRIPPTADISGQWKVTFSFGEESEYPAIGLFEQSGNELTGTFLTGTGDYRFLEGTIQGDQFFLSCFDGTHAYLFESRILEDNSLLGSYRSGKHHRTVWKAVKDTTFALPDRYSMTTPVDTSKPFYFQFENPDGEIVSVTDPQFAGKPKIIQIMGTWCPNCLDETRFLLEYFSEYNGPELPVIAVSFEKYENKEKALEVIRNYRERLNMPYEILYGGHYSKANVSEKFPMLNKFIAYPTLIFLDKDNFVKKVHTGFSGPATGKYGEFKAEFHQIVKELFQET